MSTLLNRLRDSAVASTLVSLGVGVGLDYGCAIAKRIAAPLFLAIGEAVVDPLSPVGNWAGLAVNVAWATLSGFMAALGGLILLHFAVNPKTMLYPQLAALPYLALGYWWFVSNAADIVKHSTAAQVLTYVTSPLAPVLIWLLLSWLMVRFSVGRQSNELAAA